MSAGFPASLSGVPNQTHRALLAARADSADIDHGDVLELKLGEYDGVSAIQPTLGRMRDFIGVARHEIVDEASSDTGAVYTGVAYVKFKGHASAAQGTYAKPVVGQDYLTYSALRTNIVLLTDMTDDTDVHTPQEEGAPKVLILPGPVDGGTIFAQRWADPAAAAEDGIVSAGPVATAAGAVTEVTTGITNPDYPRNVVINPAGTTADVAACNVTVTGTNILGETITEEIAVAENQAHDTLSNGAKAFATISKFSFPAQDGGGATFHLGTGDVLGLDRCLSLNTILKAYLNGSLEGTAPTVKVDSSDVESNTVDLNSALDGNTVVIFGIDNV